MNTLITSFSIYFRKALPTNPLWPVRKILELFDNKDISIQDLFEDEYEKDSNNILLLNLSIPVRY